MRTRTLIAGIVALLVASATLLVSASARDTRSDTTCNTSTACVQGTNSGSGPGVEGDTTSASTSAVHIGVFGFDDAPTSVSRAFNNAGVFGKSQFGAGLLGFSSNGFGIFATDSPNTIASEKRLRAAGGSFVCNRPAQGDSCSVVAADDESGRERSTAGLFFSKTGLGLVGISDHTAKDTNFGGPGVFGDDIALQTGTQNRGIEGDSIFGYGSIGFTFNDSLTSGVTRAGVLGVDDSFDSGTLNAGVEAFAHGIGLLAFSTAPAQPHGSAQVPAVLAICAGGGPAFIGNNGSGSPSGDIASLDCAGNLTIAGQLVQNGSPLLKTRTSTGRPVMSYAGRTTRPTIEDDGEAQMVNGAASVSIDTAFSATIDHRVPYLVFITPDGPSAGLYVTGKTPSGFQVRENGSGRSTLVFDYRIVAAPIDTPARRLPSVEESVRDLRAPAGHAPASFPAGLPQPISKP